MKKRTLARKRGGPSGATRHKPVPPQKPVGTPAQSAPKRRAGLPATYPALLEDIKSRIRTAQIKAALSVNRELIELYWSIGRDIVSRQESEGWGVSVVERLAADLQTAFPGIAGLSARNIWRMRAFFLEWADPLILPQAGAESAATRVESILTQPVAEIPWGHNLVLIEKLKHRPQRLWYAQQTSHNGWSRSMLVHWIESDLFARQGKALHNFHATLPQPQ